MLAMLVEIAAHHRTVALAQYSGAESVEPPSRLIDHPDRLSLDDDAEAEAESTDANQIVAFFGLGGK